MAKKLEVTVTGQIEICALLELPKNKKALQTLAEKIGMDWNEDSSINDVAKFIVMEALKGGLDKMDYRQSESSDVSEYSLDVEVEAN